MQFIVQEDCGNAPRKFILRDLFLAIVERDNENILEIVAEDLIYEEVGKGQYEGVPALLERVDEMVSNDIDTLELIQIITHGKTAAVNGRLVTVDQKEIHFATIVMFASAGKQAKVKKMTSYIIEI
ncbi:hypothetical protein [Oceanobacillus sp. CAU 1775]